MAETREVKPINTRETEGNTYVDEYTFSEVYIEDVPEDFHQPGVKFNKGKEAIRWEYNGKTPILIKRDKVLAKKSAPLEEAQNQAYFALSILSDEGYVSRFKQK